ncbi:MAG: hypothetical protein AAF607_08375 [Pseudomonadota bacterium]
MAAALLVTGFGAALGCGGTALLADASVLVGLGADASGWVSGGAGLFSVSAFCAALLLVGLLVFSSAISFVLSPGQRTHVRDKL